jgi:hypothetical protein
MGLIKKKDAKSYFAAKRSKQLLRVLPASKPDAADYPRVQRSPNESLAGMVEPPDESSSENACLSTHDHAELRHSAGEHCEEKCGSITPHTIFLRRECRLPDYLSLPQASVDDDWVQVSEIGSSDLDVMIRQAGWHFMYLQGSSSHTSVRLTSDGAIHHALIGALRGIASRFNAAELESIHMIKYPGFHIAKIAVQPRRIQRHTSLDSVEESRAPMTLAR